MTAIITIHLNLPSTYMLSLLFISLGKKLSFHNHAIECGLKKIKLAARCHLKFWIINFNEYFLTCKGILLGIPNLFICYLFQMAISQIFFPQTTNTSLDSYSQLMTISIVTKKIGTIMRTSICSQYHISLPTHLNMYLCTLSFHRI